MGFLIIIVIAVLGAALIAGGIIAYRKSNRVGVKAAAAAVIAAGVVAWAVILLITPASSSVGMSNPSPAPVLVPVPSEIQEITFEQLFIQPDRYSGKDIVIEGYYYQGFETIVVSEQLDYSGYAPGHLVPEGRMLWIENGVPGDIYDNAHQQQMMGPTERYGKVRIKGQFEQGGRYGHLGQFEYQIIPSEMELLDWTPAP